MFRPLTHAAVIAVIVLPLTTATADIETFDQAKTISASQGKPVLLEFFRDG